MSRIIFPKKILSIVVPSFNSEKTIGNLLESINTSKFNFFENIEAIIVDDKSKDRTKDVVNRLIPLLKFSAKFIILKKHAGPGAARNKGASIAKGVCLLFLDSDVELKLNTLALAYRLAKNNHKKVFTGIWDWKQKTDKFFPQFKAFRDWSYWLFERKKNSRYYLFSTRIAGIEKKIFYQVGRFDEKYSQLEDFDLTYRIEKISPIQFCPDLKVTHEFEDFLPIAKKYFKRSVVWAQLYRKRYQFDPVATTKKEALKSVIATLIFVFSLIGILIHQSIVMAIILFLVYAYLERQFWLFLMKKKGFIFLLQAIPTSIILYFIINLGAFWGFLSSRSVDS